MEDGQIVLMNIPYEAFYRSELKNNDVKVDAFTSATKSKNKDERRDEWKCCLSYKRGRK